MARGFSCPVACGILVPRPGIEPAFPALEGENPPYVLTSFVTFLICFMFMQVSTSLELCEDQME